ncbi:hypothetical protein LH464_05915 [Neorhizobium sp. T786]|uniref:hypothetical protein n=1 Tax=Pseudorhizobium xiangyangii TaxID=2883104 RepID=UPI001CFFE7F6|nr:hypothetical protein [Neorhizobium xiangyangii]MCB5202012.1 hypothetical protein [Neorhizobium xiangyangii]
MIERRKSIVPNKITMINLVWTTMIAAMLTATVTLYQEQSQVSDFNYPQMTGRYHDASYY